jgi:hypothetical protein
VGGTQAVLASMFVDFQVIGDVFAFRTVTEDESIRWMVKPEVFHMDSQI